MRIRVFFFFLVFFLLCLAAATAYVLREHRSLYLWGVEGGICFILLYLSYFYKKIVKPLHTIGNGMELLREQDFSSRLCEVGQHEADHIVDIFNRMMEQLKNERLRMREQNHFLDLLIQASPMGVIILTMDEEVSHLNPMAEKMLGIAEKQAVGKRMGEVASPFAAELAKIPMDDTAVIRLNDANIYKCAYSSFRDRGFKHPFYLMERMTEEVMRAEKRAYEKVIRMIAHEVNNTTAGITSTLDTVCEALEAPLNPPEGEKSEVRSQKSEVGSNLLTSNSYLLTSKSLPFGEVGGAGGFGEVVDLMHVCTERCYSMSRFITRFADVVKIPEPTLAPVKLNDLVTKCKCFMEGMTGDCGITLRLECDPEVREVRMDASLIEQVLVNIIKNAAESIDQKLHGSEAGFQPCILVRTMTPAAMEVVDNGIGISKETEAKLFSPFFSTKPHGQGIGLVFIREVLSRHNCTFSLRTYEDGLTRFRISFAV